MKLIICKDGEEVLVDDDMYDILNQYLWRVNKGGYAYTITPGTQFGNPAFTTLMHHCIVGKPIDTKEEVTDHINRITLDNRRANLRNVPHSVNIQNSARFDRLRERRAKAAS